MAVTSPHLEIIKFVLCQCVGHWHCYDMEWIYFCDKGLISECGVTYHAKAGKTDTSTVDLLFSLIIAHMDLQDFSSSTETFHVVVNWKEVYTCPFFIGFTSNSSWKSSSNAKTQPNNKMKNISLIAMEAAILPVTVNEFRVLWLAKNSKGRSLAIIDQWGISIYASTGNYKLQKMRMVWVFNWGKMNLWDSVRLIRIRWIAVCHCTQFMWNFVSVQLALIFGAIIAWWPTGNPVTFSPGPLLLP